MESGLSVLVIQEEKTRKRAYAVTALILQGLIILTFITILTLSTIAFIRDYNWNNYLSSTERNVSEALVVKDDLNFYLTPTQIKPNLADEMFQKALKSSDLPVMVVTNPKFERLSYREIPMQLFFVVLMCVLNLVLVLQLIVQFTVRSRQYNQEKWCLICYASSVFLLFVGLSIYIRSQRIINNNYIQIANIIRAEAIELTGLLDESAVAETLHSCQLRAIVRGQSPELKARLEARRVCDFEHLKLITTIVCVGAFLLIIMLLLVITWCQRESKTLDENKMGHKISTLSLYVELSPDDFRRAGFAYGDDDESSISSASGEEKEKTKKNVKTEKRDSVSSVTSTDSTGSNSSYTFGNRTKLKAKFKTVKRATESFGHNP